MASIDGFSPIAFGTSTVDRSTGLMGDMWREFKGGGAQTPGALVGLVELPITAISGERPLSRAYNWATDAAGVDPERYARGLQQEQTAGYQQEREELQQMRRDPNAGAMDILGGYLSRPAQIGGLVASSLPGVGVSGVFARGARMAGLGTRTALGAGEGGYMGGAQLAEYDPDLPDQRRAALLAGATGVVGGAVGVAGGALARRAGLEDIDVRMAGLGGPAVTDAARRPMGVFGRVAGGGAMEMGEEGAQTIFETGMANLMRDLPVTQDMTFNTVSGMLAGSVMGGAMNLRANRSIKDWEADVRANTELAADPAAPLEQRLGAVDFLTRVKQHNLTDADAEAWRAELQAGEYQRLGRVRQAEIDAVTAQDLLTGQALERDAAYPQWQGGLDPRAALEQQQLAQQEQYQQRLAEMQPPPDPTQVPFARDQAQQGAWREAQIPANPEDSLAPIRGLLAQADRAEQSAATLEKRAGGLKAPRLQPWKANITAQAQQLRTQAQQLRAKAQQQLEATSAPAVPEGVRLGEQRTAQAAAAQGEVNAPEAPQAVKVKPTKTKKAALPKGDVNGNAGQTVHPGAKVPADQGQKGAGAQGQAAQGAAAEEAKLKGLETRINSLMESKQVPKRTPGKVVPPREGASLSPEKFVAKALQQKDTEPTGPYAKLYERLRTWDRALARATGAKSEAKQNEHYAAVAQTTRGADAVVPLLYAMEQEFGTDGVDKIVKLIKDQTPVGHTDSSPHARLAAAWAAYKDGSLTAFNGITAGRPGDIRADWREEAINKKVREAGGEAPSKMQEMLQDASPKEPIQFQSGKGTGGAGKWIGKGSGLLNMLSDASWQGFSADTREMASTMYHFFAGRQVEEKKETVYRDGQLEFLPTVVIVEGLHEGRPNSPGEYDPTTHTITLYTGGHDKVTLLHEVVHAATARYVLSQKPGTTDKAVTSMMSLLDSLGKGAGKVAYAELTKGAGKDTVARLKVAFDETVGAYAKAKTWEAKLRAVAEFMSYGMTNSEFQAFLKRTAPTEAVKYALGLQTFKGRYGDEQTRTALTLWSALVNAYSWIVHGKSWASRKQYTAMDQFLTDTARILENSHTDFSKAKAPAGTKPLGATVIRIESRSGNRETAILNPTREHAETSLDKYGNEARGFADEAGKIRYVFSPELLHKDVADAEGMTYTPASKGQRAYYTDYDGNRLNQIYLARGGSENVIQYWPAGETSKTSVENGGFSGEKRAEPLYSTAPSYPAPGRGPLGTSTNPEFAWAKAFDRKRNPIETAIKAILPAFYGKDPKAMQAIEGFAKDAYAKVQENFPPFAKNLAKLAPHANITKPFAEQLGLLKLHRTAPLTPSNELHTFWERTRDPLKVAAVFNYMEEFRGLKEGELPTTHHGLTEHERDIARRAKEALDDVIAKAPDDLKTRFDGLDYINTLTVIAKTEDTLSQGLGIKNIENLASAGKKITVAQIDIAGFPDKGGKFYRLSQPTADGLGTQVTLIPENLAKPKNGQAYPLKKGESLDLARPYMWVSQGKSDGDETAHTFRPLATMESLAADKMTVESIGSAFMNTVSTLANAGAVTGFTKWMVKNSEGLVYDTLDALHAHLVDKQVARLEKLGLPVDRAKLEAERKANPVDPLQLSENSAKQAKLVDAYRAPGEWVQLPKSDALGALSGKIVSGPAWAAINDTLDRTPAISFELYNDVLTGWKSVKTIYNPPTMVGNAMSNFALAWAADIPMPTVAKAIKLYGKYMIHPESLTKQERAIMDAFHRSGATLGSWTTAEVRKVIVDAMMQSTETHGKGAFAMARAALNLNKNLEDALAKHAKTAKWGASKIHNTMTDMYAAGDNAFRLAEFMTSIGEMEKAGGFSPEQMLELAARNAQEKFLNYDIDAKWVKFARGVYLPFVSFPYAATKRFAALAKEKPWKLAEIALIYQITMAAFAAMTGDSDEEDRKKRVRDKKTDTTWFGSYAHARLPSAPGKTEYLELARWIPTPISFKDTPNEFLGFLPQSVTPSGPIIEFIAAIAGVNLYTGKSLNKDTDTNVERFYNSMEAMQKALTPPTLNKEIWQTTDATGEKPTLGQRAMRAVMPTTAVNDQAAAINQQRAIKAVGNQFDREQSSLKRMRETKKITPEEYREKSGALRKVRIERIKELREGA